MAALNDRQLRGAILGVTGFLPQSLRVRARRDLLGRLAVSKARRSDVLFVRHGKAGSTWMRVMLFRLYQVRYDLPPRRVAKSDEMNLHDPRLPRWFLTTGHYTYGGEIRKLFESPKADAFFGDKRLVFLTRNPLDLVPSWYYQLTRRTRPAKRELHVGGIEHPVDLDTISLWDFALHPELGLPNLIDYHNAWYRLLANRENTMILRYEDMRADPVAAMTRLTRFLGEDFGPAEIEDAVEFASFENMRKLEESNYFKNSGLSMRDPRDPTAFKVRRGRVGGYRDEFTPEQVAKLEAMLRERLNPELGYTPVA